MNKSKNYGELTFTILENLVKGTLTTKALMLGFLKSGRSTRLLYLKTEEELRKSEREYDNFLEAERFYKLIWKLKKEGLVRKMRDDWQLTKKGKTKYFNLGRLLLLRKKYKKQKSDEITIITFDIPNKYNRKRDWLRKTLKELGFYMLHRSVWISKIKLPKDFIADLKREEILNYIYLFKVSQEGTLHNYHLNLN